MAELISESRPIARIYHHCMASEWILEGDPQLPRLLSFSECRALVVARRDNWEIKKGSRYIRQVCKYEGELFTFKARPELHEICLKHNLYLD